MKPGNHLKSYFVNHCVDLFSYIFVYPKMILMSSAPSSQSHPVITVYCCHSIKCLEWGLVCCAGLRLLSS